MEALNGNSNLLIGGKRAAFVYKGKKYPYAVAVYQHTRYAGTQLVALQGFTTVEKAEAWRRTQDDGGLTIAKILDAEEAIEILRTRWKDPHEAVG